MNFQCFIHSSFCIASHLLRSVLCSFRLWFASFSDVRKGINCAFHFFRRRRRRIRCGSRAMRLWPLEPVSPFHDAHIWIRCTCRLIECERDCHRTHLSDTNPLIRFIVSVYFLLQSAIIFFRINCAFLLWEKNQWEKRNWLGDYLMIEEQKKICTQTIHVTVFISRTKTASTKKWFCYRLHSRANDTSFESVLHS